MTARGPDLATLFSYAGGSMYPTFRHGDLLQIAPATDRSLHVGDVVVFSLAQAAGAVVHRVVAVTPEGLRTRGDACPAPDPWLVPPARIAGVVVAYLRPPSGTLRPLSRGLRGRLSGSLRRSVLGPAARGLRGLARLSSRLLALTPFLARLRLSPSALRLVDFTVRGQPRRRLLLGRHVVAEYDGATRRWSRTSPLALLLDLDRAP